MQHFTPPKRPTAILTVEAVTAAAAKGARLAQMADQFNVAYNTVRQFCRRHKIEVHTQAVSPAIDMDRLNCLLDSGKDIPEIAAAMGRSPKAIVAAIRRYAKRPPVQQRKIDLGQMRAMIDAGKTPVEIAKRFACTARAVRIAAERCGLTVARRTIDPAVLRELAESGLTAPQIAKEMGFGEISILKASYRLKLKLHTHVVCRRISAEDVRAGTEAGLSSRQIAKNLGFSATTVKTAIRNHNIARLPRVPKTTRHGKIPQAVSGQEMPKGLVGHTIPSPVVEPHIPVRRLAVPRDLPPTRPPVIEADDLPYGYVTDLIQTCGKYEALTVWAAQYSGRIGRRITATMAQAAWHKYRPR